jgi:hypothetical protein
MGRASARRIFSVTKGHDKATSDGRSPSKDFWGFKLPDSLLRITLPNEVSLELAS